MEALFDAAIRLGASDIHLSVGSLPVVRVGGALGPVEGFDELSADDLDALGAWMGVPRQDQDRDFAFVHRGCRFRINAYRQRDSRALACRLIPATVPRLDDLGLPSVLRTFVSLPRGLVLLCGPTGSGKTTTLAALVDAINSTRAVHITTIEDPVEYLHADKRSLIHQREVGGDTAGFAPALRSVLRQDPDVILVGEMRDTETVDAALTAAETGHLVLSTLHTGTAEASVGRVVNAFPVGQRAEVATRLAAVLRAVVCQALLPRIDRVGERTVVTEVMINTRAIANLIRAGQTHQIPSHIETGSAEGMHTLRQALATAVAAGRVGPDVVL